MLTDSKTHFAFPVDEIPELKPQGESTPYNDL